MRYLTFSDQTSYPVCFLVSQIDKQSIVKYYTEPFGIKHEEVIAIELHASAVKKKTPVAEMKEWIQSELIETLTDCQVEYLIVNDSEYFKVLTKSTKADLFLGYVLPCVFGPWQVIYIPSFRVVFYDPDKIKMKIAQAVDALDQHRSGLYQPPGDTIIKFAAYPQTYDEIKAWLQKLLDMKCPLTCDIEGFSLRHYAAGIGTITFCWNQEEGIAFPIDFKTINYDPDTGNYGVQISDPRLKELLRAFFEAFTEKMIYHHISFDVMVLIYQLFMKDILDTEGLLEGMEVMLRNWDDTKLIAYLATNSCAGNRNGLKDQAQEYAGNYAVEEIKDIRKMPLPKLLQYNLVDGLSTWYVHNKRYPQMVADDQLDVYETIFKPAIKDIIQMQLTGMPLDMKRVLEVEIILQDDSDAAVNKMTANPLVQQFNHHLNEQWVIKRNNELKVKRVTIADGKEEFNPNSPDQLVELLYNKIGLPVIARTKSKEPSTKGDVLKSLKFHTKDPIVLDLLDGLIAFKSVNKILTGFIPAMKAAKLGPDGWYYLFGNFNLGGTVSGRLSSSEPNLQNLPAKGKYAKLIKSCFVAPTGWLFCGLDFASLEDRISALTTKDPVKLSVYTDGYDGHCLRAYAYFGSVMTNINPDDVASINSIAELYPDERQESKAPTFALTYAGTFKTLMTNCGFDEEKALSVEAKYHDLYFVSDAWVKAKIDQACIDGYVTVAFGLRVRTPLLAQVIRGTSKTPFEAEAEGRTAGNALGQSWCLLNSRAGSEFMEKVRKSKHRLEIRPCAQIHDAGYFLIRDDMEPLLFTNEHLVKAVQWQDHPDIWHDEVKLGGELSIFYPHWGKEMTIPNYATVPQIDEAIAKHMKPKE